MTDSTQDAAFLAQPHRRVRAASCVVLGVLVFGAWILLKNGDVTSETNEAGQHPIAMRAEGLRSVIWRKDGKKLWEFSAKTSDITADHAYASASGVENGILYKNGAPFWRIKAQNVKLDQRTFDVDVKGGVEARGPNGLSVKTQRAVWKQQPERLILPEPVEASAKGFKVTSGSASYDSKRDELRCVTAVTVTSSSAILKSPQATAYPKKQIVRFEGGEIIIRRRAIQQ